MTESNTAGEMVPPRVLSLSEAAVRLRMKRSNVAKFLARRNVEHAIEKAQGYFWWEADIERVKAEREADTVRMASDERRRASALRRRGEVPQPDVPPELARLGRTQLALLGELLRRPVPAESNAHQKALRRLQDRGLVEPLPGVEMTFRLTRDGRNAASKL